MRSVRYSHGMSSDTTWLSASDCSLEDFQAVVEQTTSLADYPHAVSIDQNVVIYDCAAWRAGMLEREPRRELQAELIRVFLTGPGIAVFRGAFDDVETVDNASSVFQGMIADQHASGLSSGDHFAKPGSNDRVWNALEKLAHRDPAVFCSYYSNDIIALVCAAWLGPGYQVTSQVNVVNPGGAAQEPHRDYHLGFQTDVAAEQFPLHVHRMSPQLTLQGAVAHTDMPIASGPTVYLPYSQCFDGGYLAWRRADFNAYFWDRHTQLPLQKGDAVFFNPAVFHAAGHNTTADVYRMANLLQVSSPFGRAMEIVDRYAMTRTVVPVLQALFSAGVSCPTLRNVIASCADGYAFPTNLDRDQPIDGSTPESQAQLAWRAVEELWPLARLEAELEAHAARREP